MKHFAVFTFLFLSVLAQANEITPPERAIRLALNRAVEMARLDAIKQAKNEGKDFDFDLETFDIRSFGRGQYDVGRSSDFKGTLDLHFLPLPNKPGSVKLAICTVRLRLELTKERVTRSDVVLEEDGTGTFLKSKREAVDCELQ